jgi:hypothetical protein
MAASDTDDAGAASPDLDFGADLDESSEIMTESLLALQSSTAVKTESNASGSSDQHTPTNGNSAPSKPNPKDPSRPRRKKARRACFACQRAHLTCGKCLSSSQFSGLPLMLTAPLQVTSDHVSGASSGIFKTSVMMVSARRRSTCLTLPLSC